MTEVRCKDCNRKLAVRRDEKTLSRYSNVINIEFIKKCFEGLNEVKCPKCGTINKI